jgi:uncharacterized iron-regulated membrane protein
MSSDSLAVSSIRKRSFLGGLVWLHRWTGLVVCLFFALWFASGAVMLFAPFPSLSATERNSHSEILDPALVAVSPARVVAGYPNANSLTLRARDRHPVYVLGNGSESPVIIDAMTGLQLPLLEADAGKRIAEQFSGERALRVDAAVDYDQWIVHEGFASGRPYHRVTLDDAANTVLHVSAVTGEVRQRTTRVQRVLNAVGAVPHWLYWTAIRKHWSAWDSLVWWLSLLAFASALLGMVLGVYRFLQSRTKGGSGWRVYVSWWRWHHVLGLIAGVFLLGWISSGWLSMDHGRLFSRGGVTDDAAERMRGASLSDFANAVSIEDLARLGNATAVQFRSVAGRGFMLVQRQQAAAELVESRALVENSLPDDRLLQALKMAFPDATEIQSAESHAADLYARAEELPDSARLFLVRKPELHRVYVDNLTGEILVDQDASRRAYAWIYYALHTYKVPALAGRDFLRIPLMLLLLVAGFSLSVTGAVIAWRRLRATLARTP